MKRWLPLAAILVISACSTQPTPRPPLPGGTPALSIATVVPIPTLLPTVIVNAPTPIPVTATSAAAPTRRGSSPTRAPNQFAAPTALGPKAPALFKDGNDIKFVYGSVGKLAPNQCYLLHIELAVPKLEKGNRGDDFLDAQNCGDAGPAGKKLMFVLYRGKFTNSPNYGTMLAQVHELSPEARALKMTWTVRVVQNNGRAADGVHYNTAALSPTSPLVEFDFQP